MPLREEVAAMLGIVALPEAEPPQTPRPRTATLGAPAAAVAVMAILGFGVIVGSVVSPVAESSPTPALVAVTASAATQAPPVAPPTAPAAAATAAPAAVPVQQTIPAPAPPAPPAPAPVVPEPTGPELPAVKHVFMIVLPGHGYDATFGPDSQAPYLAGTLTKQGELLTNYYAVTGGELANRIALVSGQGPNPDTAGGCQTESEFTPGPATTDPVQKGQAIGSGCVFPRSTLTVADELVANGNTWKAYVEDPPPPPDGQPVADGQAPPCGHPATNPLAHFHSIIDLPNCAQTILGIDQLTTDLASADTTPTLSYIVPNACHDGTEQPCAPDQPAGLPAADAFLKDLIPRITGSPAYKDGGMIAITFAAAPQDGPNADSSACCTEPAYPNMPPPAPADQTATPAPAGPLPPGADAAAGGGGRVGLLLISPFVKAGSVNSVSNYNHYSLLRSIEDLFGLQPTGYAGYPGLLAFDNVIYNAPGQK
jgi:hypothetical protein